MLIHALLRDFELVMFFIWPFFVCENRVRIKFINIKFFFCISENCLKNEFFMVDYHRFLQNQEERII